MPAALNKLAEILGESGVITDRDIAQSLLTDERRQYHGRAAAIVQPASVAELAAVVRVCAEARIAMVPQGGNTGYCGGATPDESGTQVLINLSRLDAVRKVDVNALCMTAGAGTVLADAQAVAADHGLLLPLSMASEASCQLGGVVSTNAGGVAVLRYGTTRDLVLGLEVVLPNGAIWHDLRGLRKNNTGYDLKQLFIGAEGTLGIVGSVVLRLYPAPRRRHTAWLKIADLDAAVWNLATMRGIFGDCITSYEYISQNSLTAVLAEYPDTRDPIADSDGDSVLVELSTFDDEHDDSTLRRFERTLVAEIDTGRLTDAAISHNITQARKFWRLREAIPEAEKRAGGAVKHDISVSQSDLAAFTHETSAAILDRFPGSRLSIFGHVGDGNLHFNVLAMDRTRAQEYKDRFAERISAEIHERVLAHGGSFSAEHGIGQLKRDLLASTGDPVGLNLMRELKAVLDPHRLMNPGKLI